MVVAQRSVIPACEAHGGERAFFVTGGSSMTLVSELRDINGRRFYNASTLVVQWSQQQQSRLLTFAQHTNTDRLHRVVNADTTLRGVATVFVSVPGYDDGMLKKLLISYVILYNYIISISLICAL